jgi:transcriptional regulator with XRE-family HTH domain
MLELPGPDPTIQRRRLRSELRTARENANKTQRETAEAMDWSMSKLIRIETGDVRISTNDLRALLSYYTVEAERVTHLVEVARAAREPARWSRYRNVASPEYLTFLGYESSASIIRNFEPILVPGLLQTEEYARVLLNQIDEPQKVDSLVDLRIERQEILVREPSPPLCHFIIDESVIRHVVGGIEVMRRQLLQMKELAAQPHITLRIATFDLGVYSRMRVPYVLFEFEEAEDEDVLYIENATDELVIRENSRLEDEKNGPSDYLQSFWSLEQIAHREQTAAILDDALSNLTPRPKSSQ